jgi:hypothetical protein
MLKANKRVSRPVKGERQNNLYTEEKRDGSTDRRMNRQTEEQRDGRRGRQKNRQKEEQTDRGAERW